MTEPWFKDHVVVTLFVCGLRASKIRYKIHRGGSGHGGWCFFQVGICVPLEVVAIAGKICFSAKKTPRSHADRACSGESPILQMLWLHTYISTPWNGENAPQTCPGITVEGFGRWWLHALFCQQERSGTSRRISKGLECTNACSSGFAQRLIGFKWTVPCSISTFDIFEVRTNGSGNRLFLSSRCRYNRIAPALFSPLQALPTQILLPTTREAHGSEDS